MPRGTASHVHVIHKINFDDPAFERPVTIALRDDHVIEIYAVNEYGLEEYVNRLDRLTTLRVVQMQTIMKAIKSTVGENPFSTVALAWLYALNQGGLLDTWQHYV